jgi:hypothetical protein
VWSNTGRCWEELRFRRLGKRERGGICSSGWDVVLLKVEGEGGAGARDGGWRRRRRRRANSEMRSLVLVGCLG